MPGAAEKIAAKLAAKQSSAPAPAEVEDDDTDELESSEEAEAAPAKSLTREERRAARLAKQGKAPEPVEEDEEEEAPPPKKAIATKPGAAIKAKKAPSPAQIAAREAFAARSRANAAAKAAPKAPVQTDADVRAKQNADRKAARDKAAAEAKKVRSTPTGKAVKIAAATSPAVKAKGAPDKPVKVAASKAVAKPKAPAKAKGEAKTKGDTKAKVLALVKQGKTRPEIAEALGLSYASVFYHTKDLESGAPAVARGKIQVETNLDEEGHKLRGGKKVTIHRSEAMRRMYLSGMSVGDIARSFTGEDGEPLRYQIAYTAVKGLIGTVEADNEQD